MVSKLNGTTEIWADGYSYREVTETLITALGLRLHGLDPSQPEPGRAESAASMGNGSPNGSPTDR
jgi:hypothetical protein